MRCIFNDFFLIIEIIQLINIGLLIILFFYPNGIINLKETRGLFLEAFSKGAVNDTTTLKLYKNNEFKELNICFGITSAEGTYRIENDTVYFDSKIIPKHSDRYYDFAIIKIVRKNLKLLGSTRTSKKPNL